MFNLAEVWGLRPDHSNPCLHVKKYPEQKRERFLSPEEYAAQVPGLDVDVCIFSQHGLRGAVRTRPP